MNAVMHGSPVRFGIIGVGGFARSHIESILALEKHGLVRLEAAADPSLSLIETTFTNYGHAVPSRFADYHEMLRSTKLDAVMIATPLHLHCEMAEAALEAGFAVFMEKPPVVSLEQWNRVMAAIRKSGKPCGIDFQTMSGKQIRDLKRWVVEGKLGQIQSVVGFSHQKRYDAYYERTSWAGKIQLGGKLVRDGSVNNPMAHQLNSALHIASNKPFEWVQPTHVRAELYRAHPIETEDTTCMEISTKEGPKVYFYTTLCSKHHSNHTGWLVAGDKATAFLDTEKLQLRNGDKVFETIQYKPDELGSVETMVENMVLHLLGKADRLICPFEKTRAFVASVEGMFQSSGVVRLVPDSFVKRFPMDGSIATEILDIDENLQEAVRRKVLLSDLKVPWATATKPYALPAA
ncbi:MAG: Gfo/Idh/MocA family oxidoreductase [Verrucomicrobiae bacterium]|nr:Gfo/Idh/MocA family oxidoreductase [Verrucomicrobiae bacterium]